MTDDSIGGDKTYLKPFQQRVVDEKRELDDKIQKLDVFVRNDTMFRSLSTLDQRLLREQLVVMHDYHRILGERIELFQPAAASGA